MGSIVIEIAFSLCVYLSTTIAGLAELIAYNNTKHASIVNCSRLRDGEYDNGKVSSKNKKEVSEELTLIQQFYGVTF